jgi:hypothetical protein
MLLSNKFQQNVVTTIKSLVQNNFCFLLQQNADVAPITKSEEKKNQFPTGIHQIIHIQMVFQVYKIK